jgi:hypothetical protein
MFTAVISCPFIDFTVKHFRRYNEFNLRFSYLRTIIKYVLSHTFNVTVRDYKGQMKFRGQGYVLDV